MDISGGCVPSLSVSLLTRTENYCSELISDHRSELHNSAPPAAAGVWDPVFNPHNIKMYTVSTSTLPPLPLRGPRRRLNVEYIFMINTFTRGYLWDSSQQPTHNFLRNLYLCQSCQFSNFPPSRSFGSGMVQAEEYASEHCAVLQIVKQISLHYDRLEPGEGMPPPPCWLTSAMTWRDMAWHVTRDTSSVMVVMSQLYLCDEPYWSRFHVTGPPPQPSIHVISDGKIEAGETNGHHRQFIKMAHVKCPRRWQVIIPTVPCPLPLTGYWSDQSAHTSILTQYLTPGFAFLPPLPQFLSFARKFKFGYFNSTSISSRN